MSPSPSLAGRVVLITGASRGIGRAVAVACAAAGATVIAGGRDVRALGALSDELAATDAPPVVLLPIDLERATVEHYDEVAGHVREQFTRLDGLVLNAAALGELAPLAHQDPLLWARVFQVNVHSPFMLLQALEPLLCAAADPAVVFSLAPEGERPPANWGAYAASKGALRGLMQLAAAENPGGARMRVHGVCPPPTRTRLRSGAFPAAGVAGLAAPESVAAAYVDLLGPHGAGHHGEIVEPPGPAS